MSKEFFELTMPQESIWEIQQFYAGSSIANIGGTFLLKEKTDLELLEKAINIFIEKNEGVRIRLSRHIGSILQYFEPFTYRNIEVVDYSNKSYDEMHNDISKWMKDIFDIYDKDLFHFKIIKTNINEYGFFIKFHHIIADAWTIANLGDQFLSNYNSLNEAKLVDECIPSYKEFIKNDFKYTFTNRYERDMKFWKDKYQNEPVISTAKRSKVIDITGTADRLTFRLEKDIVKKITTYCSKNKLSPAIFFETIMVLYLHKISGEKDISIGIFSLNRSNSKEKRIAGMFINTLPLRISVDDKKSFLDLCNKVSSEHFSLLRHQKFPYRKILDIVRNEFGSINRLFDIIVSYQNANIRLNHNDRNFQTKWYLNGYSESPLQVHIDDRDDRGIYILHFDYLTRLFSKKEIENIYNRVLAILSQILSFYNINLDDIELISNNEKNLLLYDFNNTYSEYPSDKCIHQIFEEQVQTRPDDIALIFKNETLTFRELDNKANIVANLLRKKECVLIL